jgi:hypothetical protein
MNRLSSVLFEEFDLDGSSGGSWNDALSRRRFLKRMGGATAVTLVAWHASSLQSRGQTENPEAAESGTTTEKKTVMDGATQDKDPHITEAVLGTWPGGRQFVLRLRVTSGIHKDTPKGVTAHVAGISIDGAIVLHEPAAGGNPASDISTVTTIAPKKGGIGGMITTPRSDGFSIDGKTIKRTPGDNDAQTLAAGDWDKKTVYFDENGNGSAESPGNLKIEVTKLEPKENGYTISAKLEWDSTGFTGSPWGSKSVNFSDVEISLTTREE